MSNGSNETANASSFQLHHGDCLEVLKTMPDESVDSVVTDPPAGIFFMGKEWDRDKGGRDSWIAWMQSVAAECLRVVKPGGHALVWAIPRTSHWTGMAWENAGWEPRDKIVHLFGSGFPKSLSVSKQMDSMEKKRWSDICKSVDNLDCFDILEKWKENSKNASNAGLLFLTTSERESNIMLPEGIVPLLVPASEYQEGSQSNTQTELGSVNPVAKTSQRRQTETGWSTQRSGSVLGTVVLEVHPENKNAVALIAELRSLEVSPTSKERCIVQDSAEVITTPLPSLVTAVARLSENQNPLIKENISTVHIFVRDLQNEKMVGNLKAAEALKIWLGSKPSSRLGDTIALCAALTDDLKRIILSKSEMFLSADMIRQMEFVSAINVTITESMAESLILFTADILKSKAIDKAAGAEREVVGKDPNYHSEGKRTGVHAYKSGESDGSQRYASSPGMLTAPATDAAKQWDGWGTALKPAAEDWWLLRKPLSENTIAQNILRHGCGGLNIDGTRVGMTPDDRAVVDNRSGAGFGTGNTVGGDQGRSEGKFESHSQGRWPANIILSDDPEVLAGFPETKSGKFNQSSRKAENKTYGEFHGYSDPKQYPGDQGSAARFFYCAKASKADRDAGCGEVITWENVGLSQETEELLLLARDTSEDILQRMGNTEWNTLSFGSGTTEKFQMDFKSIMSTVTRLITGLKTSNYYPSSNTRDFILDVTRAAMESGLNLAESVESTSELMKNITEERTGSVLGVVAVALKTLLKIKENGKVGNIHSTVKPTSLMRYLSRLICPPGGVVLDPFMGSGSTGRGAILEGFKFVGIEREAEYMEIAQLRINDAVKTREEELKQADKEVKQLSLI